MKYKMKTNSSAKKRFKVTGSGKILRKSVGMRHLLEHKSKSSKRSKQGLSQIHPSDFSSAKRLLVSI